MFGYSCSFALGELPLRFGLAAFSALDTSPPAVFCQRLSAAEWAELVAGQFAPASFVVRISFHIETSSNKNFNLAESKCSVTQSLHRYEKSLI